MRLTALFFFASVSLSALAADSAELIRRLDAAKTEQDFGRLLGEVESEFSSTTLVGQEADQARENEDWKESRTRLRAALLATNRLEYHATDQKLSDPRESAKAILRDPKYRDPGATRGRNWMSGAFDRIGKAIEDFLKRLELRPDASMNPGSAPGWNLVTPVVFGGLGLGLAAFLIFFLIKFRFGSRGRRSGQGLLGDEEIDHTADEWLTRATELERLGQNREAVRCLYLATLTRLDEAQVLNFIRSETNWEHLRRFERSADRPESIDLRFATKEFDRVWYGHRDRGPEDVRRFRDFYQNVLTVIRGART